MSWLFFSKLFLITLPETTAEILVFSCTERTKPLEEEEMGNYTKGKESKARMIRKRSLKYSVIIYFFKNVFRCECCRFILTNYLSNYLKLHNIITYTLNQFLIFVNNESISTCSIFATKTHAKIARI